MGGGHFNQDERAQGGVQHRGKVLPWGNRGGGTMSAQRKRYFQLLKLGLFHGSKKKKKIGPRGGYQKERWGVLS